MLEIILFQPQIPQNTGNIVRTCSVTGCKLTLVHPLGFSTQSRWLKRAGLDYWEGVEIQEVDDLIAHLEKGEGPLFFFSSKGTKDHYDADFTANSRLVFGSETEGLPAEVFERWGDRIVKIPMLPGARCLNLATSVGIGTYEAIRRARSSLKTQAVGNP